MPIKKSTLRAFVVLAICLVAVFYPDPTASSRSLATTDEAVSSARLLASTDCENCKIPDYLGRFSLITEGDAAISPHSIYRGIAVGGVLTDSSPQTNSVVSSNFKEDSYIYKTDGKININFNGPVKYDATLADAGIDFDVLKCLAKRAKTAQMGQYNVIVATKGGTVNMYDFVNGGQGEDNGNTIVIFQTTEDIILEKTNDGRQFGPTVFAPFSNVEVTGSTGFVDGVIVAKSFYSPESASSVQLHGDGYRGALACIEAPPTPAPVQETKPPVQETRPPVDKQTVPPVPAPVEETKPPVTFETKPPVPAPVEETRPPVDKQTVPPVPAPVEETKPPVTFETKPPVPAPVEETKPPVTFETKPPVPAPVEETRPPVRIDTKPPVPVEETQPPFDGGVNGDPLIMGLSGQLFKFDGHSGAWYSAVSTPSFQWNLKVNSYETCPQHSDTFVSAAGFTFFNKKGKITKRIEVNVANAYNVDVGCGSSQDQSCLGAGSLELVIDGVKHVVGGDYKTKDGSARITAFNTFFQCSRKWYDFDVRPREDPSKGGSSLRSGRGLDMDTDIFSIISGLKSTMIDENECQKWIQDRQAYGDLFQQPGHYSTIVIKTADITLHLEYKQESERCNAHSVDVWISSVSPALLEENWEGIIGETKDPNYVPTGDNKLMVDRIVALKYPSDEDYEVNSPFSTRCRGCNHK